MIKLDSDTGVKRIKELHASLLEELSAGGDVILDFSDIERVDLSLVQLIMAAGREARARNVTVKLKSVPRSVRYQMQICGLKI